MAGRSRCPSSWICTAQEWRRSTGPSSASRPDGATRDNRLPHTRQDWLTNQDRLLSQFLQPRPAYVLNWLKGAGLYPNIDAPVFNIDGTYQHGGHVAANAALSMQASATVWYTLDGSDPRVPGTTPQAAAAA